MATRFPISLFGTPSEPLRDVFLTVVRAGRVIAGPEHIVERDYYPGHELILCTGGKGWVRVRGRAHPVEAGQLLWVNCHHPHSYGSVKEAPWTADWIRVEGVAMDRLWAMLGADVQPVFESYDLSRGLPCCSAVFENLEHPRQTSAAWNQVHVSTLLALACESRQSHPLSQERELPAALEKVMQHMRVYYHKPLRVAELARMAGMSPSHFNRQFRHAVGSSPIDWLRHYRINQAKRRLIESPDPIKEVARQVGYADQFYFSKDFKKLTSMTPTAFRLSEAGGPGTKT
jgi:AraC family transcriptional regulator, arabinose operon regulatory protein